MILHTNYFFAFKNTVSSEKIRFCTQTSAQLKPHFHSEKSMLHTWIFFTIEDTFLFWKNLIWKENFYSQFSTRRRKFQKLLVSWRQKKSSKEKLHKKLVFLLCFFFGLNLKENSYFCYVFFWLNLKGKTRIMIINQIVLTTKNNCKQKNLQPKLVYLLDRWRRFHEIRRHFCQFISGTFFFKRWHKYFGSWGFISSRFTSTR